MADQKRVRFYKASDMTSLTILERTCETQEVRLTSAIISLEIAKSIDDTASDQGTRGTAATYKEVDGGNLGRLTLVEFDDDNDALTKQTQHQLPQETLLFKGRAMIGEEIKNLMVFRVNRV